MDGEKSQPKALDNFGLQSYEVRHTVIQGNQGQEYRRANCLAKVRRYMKKLN
jgi:hypothetical protein